MNVTLLNFNQLNSKEAILSETNQKQILAGQHELASSL
jgi:hypothetical protein